MKRPGFAFGAKIGGKAKRVWICDACATWHDTMPGKKNGPRACKQCGGFCRHFPSQAEARKYMELRMLQQHGAISDLKCQPVFHIEVNGVRLGKYIADFQYTDLREIPPVIKTIDVKGGAMTELSDWKRRHAQAQYGVSITLVKP